jgi:hypothetical protein
MPGEEGVSMGKERETESELTQSPAWVLPDSQGLGWGLRARMTGKAISAFMGTGEAHWAWHKSQNTWRTWGKVWRDNQGPGECQAGQKVPTVTYCARTERLLKVHKHTQPAERETEVQRRAVTQVQKV